MRNSFLLAIVIGAGCGTTSARNHQGSAVSDQQLRQQDSLAACFDNLAKRTGTKTQLGVDLTVVVHDGRAWLVPVATSTTTTVTVVDAKLRDCLDHRAIGWVVGGGATAVVPLHIAPRPIADARIDAAKTDHEGSRPRE